MANDSHVSKTISSSIELLLTIQSEMQQSYIRLLETATKVKNKKRVLLAQLPYHINVIDELHINENAHSRILAKLLQFADSEGCYVFLESLLEYVKSGCQSDEFKQIEIHSPRITQEKGRIDLWVRDYKSKYALIFENKIYDANDQAQQLYRYIEKTRECGFKDSNIFIFYLTKYGKKPTKQTWGNNKTFKVFQSRYMALSFRNDILYWLKTWVLPYIRHIDGYLQSAVTQYIDYLEGLFDIRQNYKSLYMNIQRIISDKLGLASVDDMIERYQKIEEAINDIETLKNSLSQMKEDVFEECIQQHIKQWISNYKTPSSKFEVCCDFNGWKERILFGVKFICDEKPTFVVIGVDGHNLFCQVQRDIKCRSKNITANRFSLYSVARRFLGEESDIYIYDYFDLDFENAYSTFCELVKVINKKI